MGGRGNSSGMVSAPHSTIPPNYKMLSQDEADGVFDDMEEQYDINTILAINQYIRQDLQSNGFTMSQNMNHKLENDMKLNANEQYVADRLTAGMHDLGRDLVLTRAAHKDFLESLGVKNYQNMTSAQLNAAVKGAEYTEKKFVSTAIDPKKNPFMSGPQSGGREVYIHIKAPKTTKSIMGNRKQSEVILGKGVKFRATGARFDGTMAYPRSGGALPRVVVDVEII